MVERIKLMSWNGKLTTNTHKLLDDLILNTLKDYVHREFLISLNNVKSQVKNHCSQRQKYKISTANVNFHLQLDEVSILLDLNIELIE